MLSARKLQIFYIYAKLQAFSANAIPDLALERVRSEYTEFYDVDDKRHGRNQQNAKRHNDKLPGHGLCRYENFHNEVSCHID